MLIDIIQTLLSKDVIVIIIGAFTTAGSFLFGMRYRNLQFRKMAGEAENSSIEAKIKKEEYEEMRYNKLLKRLQETDLSTSKLNEELERVTELTKTLSYKLKEIALERDEIRAELNLYKTINS